MARSAIDAGWDVTVYARWHRGSPADRAAGRLSPGPGTERVALPGSRPASAGTPTASSGDGPNGDIGLTGVTASTASPPRRPRPPATSRSRSGDPSDSGPWNAGTGGSGSASSPCSRWAGRSPSTTSPNRPTSGMGCGRVPCRRSIGCAARQGGRTIYDSRDIFMHSRKFARLGRPGRSVLEWAERRWARRADRVLTVNEPYADLIEEKLRVPRPPIVMNNPATWTPPTPPPDLHPRGPRPVRRDGDRALPGHPDLRTRHRTVDGGDPRRAVGSARADGLRTARRRVHGRPASRPAVPRARPRPAAGPAG